MAVVVVPLDQPVAALGAVEERILERTEAGPVEEAVVVRQPPPQHAEPVSSAEDPLEAVLVAGAAR